MYTGAVHNFSPQALQGVVNSREEKKPTEVVVIVTYFTYVQPAESNALPI